MLGCEYCTISPSTRVLSIANSPALNPYPVSHPNPPGVSGSDAPSLGGPLGQEPVSLSLFVPSRLKASVLSWRCTGCTAWCTPRERGVHSWRCTGGTAWCTPKERGARGCCIYLPEGGAGRRKSLGEAGKAAGRPGAPGFCCIPASQFAGNLGCKSERERWDRGCGRLKPGKGADSAWIFIPASPLPSPTRAAAQAPETFFPFLK